MSCVHVFTCFICMPICPYDMIPPERVSTFFCDARQICTCSVISIFYRSICLSHQQQRPSSSRTVATTSHVTPSHATTPAYNPNINYEHTSTYAIRMTPSRYTRTVPMEQYYYILHYLGTVFKTKRVLGQENSMSGGRVYFCVRRTIRPE